MATVKLTNDNFDEIINSNKKVLVDFYANWCGPCKMLSPILEEIANEHPEYVIGKVNVDEEHELASRFSVFSIPTLVVMNGGSQSTRVTGARPKEQILALLEN